MEVNSPGFSFEFIPDHLPKVISKGFIGIDPDTDKSGVAIVENGKITNLYNLSFWWLIEFLSLRKDHHVFIEAGYLNRSLSHHPAQNKFTAAKIGSHVGANHQIGKLIAEYCHHAKIDFTEVKPTARKLSQEAFKQITGWPKRTNQEVRDAAMLVFGRKNLQQ